MNSNQQTIRDMVQAIQNEIAKGELQPERASELLVKLAALTGNIGEEIIKRDYEYGIKLLHFLESEEKASHAKIKAEVSDEYLAKKRTYAIRDLAQELIRSLKYFLRAKQEELEGYKSYK